MYPHRHRYQQAHGLRYQRASTRYRWLPCPKRKRVHKILLPARRDNFQEPSGLGFSCENIHNHPGLCPHHPAYKLRFDRWGSLRHRWLYRDPVLHEWLEFQIPFILLHIEVLNEKKIKIGQYSFTNLIMQDVSTVLDNAIFSQPTIKYIQSF